MHWKLALIAAIMALTLWSFFDKGIRLGKDLAGGLSLTYQLNIDPTEANPSEVVSQTIDVIKRRLDPNGVLDFTITPQGQDRFEIVAPLPTQEVREAQAKYRALLDEILQAARIDGFALNRALDDGTTVERWGGGEGNSLRPALLELQSDFDEKERLRASYAAMESDPNADPAELARVEQSIAEIEVSFQEQFDAVLRAGLSETELRRTLQLSTEPRKRLDESGKAVLDEGGEPIVDPSVREVELSALKSRFPHLSSRIDEMIETFDVYNSKRTGFDDPEDLKRLLRGAGVLEFRIAVTSANAQGINPADLRETLAEQGPEFRASPLVLWMPINDLKEWYKTEEQLAMLMADPAAYFAGRQGMIGAEYKGRHYLLIYDAPGKKLVHERSGDWALIGAGRATDELGRAAVSFRLDTPGGLEMGKLTGAHVGQPMAIVLDGEVYSAPNLESRIGSNGVIQGDFSAEEINYLIRVLTSGSLSARLDPEPIAENQLGPALGADNLERGLKAFVLSVALTAVMMLAYYFFAGVVANIALLLNAAIIFGTMAMIDGTFTLPGLAGIALSIAMAVDANVLIYERVREEMLNNKEDLRTSIRLGYKRALNAIVDGNVAHLITCIVLMYMATTEVRGFALTMILGTVATLFTALFITRVIFTFYTEAFKAKRMPMLPTVFPAITRAMTPSVDWVSKRRIFQVIGVLCVGVALTLFVSQGREMLDTEFRGGLSLTMQTRLAEPGEPRDDDERLLLARPQVEQEVREIGEQAGPTNPILYELRNSSVLTLGRMTPDFEASTFRIKVTSPTGVEEDETITSAVVDAVVAKFGDRIDVAPRHTFQGSGDLSGVSQVFPVRDDSLGENIGRPEFTQSVGAYRGGVAVFLDDLNPPATTTSVATRVERLREQPDFASTSGRQVEVIGLEQAPGGDPDEFRSMAVLVYDDNLREFATDAETWNSELAAKEWRLISTALQSGNRLQAVDSFSPAIAASLAASAVVAVILSLLGMLIYIWIRFGSLRYSVSTVIAVTHNVFICLGALALTHMVAGTKLAAWLMIDSFRIDLNVIAALLTIIGYSLNDTIVILDRIRENRGKQLHASAAIINASINQTFSRTILTGGSTILASLILFILGGAGLQPFAFTFLIGLLVGTYSSVAIAAPIVYRPPGPDLETATGSEIIRRRSEDDLAPAASPGVIG